MSWTKEPDERWDISPFRELSKDAKLLHLCTLAMCSQDLTDGFATRRMVNIAAAKVEVDLADCVFELAESGLWESQGASEWFIPEYPINNRTADELATERTKTAERQRNYRDRHKAELAAERAVRAAERNEARQQARAEAVRNAVIGRNGVTAGNAVTGSNGVGNADSNAPRNGAGNAVTGRNAPRNGAGNAPRNGVPVPVPVPVPEPDTEGSYLDARAQEDVSRARAFGLDPWPELWEGQREAFVALQEAYPKPVDDELWPAFQHAVSQPEIAPEVMSGLAAFMRTSQWSENPGRYATNPKEWIERQRWRRPPKEVTNGSQPDKSVVTGRAWSPGATAGLGRGGDQRRGRHPLHDSDDVIDVGVHQEADAPGPRRLPARGA